VAGDRSSGPQVRATSLKHTANGDAHGASSCDGCRERCMSTAITLQRRAGNGRKLTSIVTD
jgi:hypothetical protein